MKIAESWLREWVNPDLDTEALGHQLTMLGHEVDGIEYEGAGIEDIVVAEVVECGKHPDADLKLAYPRTLRTSVAAAAACLALLAYWVPAYDSAYVVSSRIDPVIIIIDDIPDTAQDTPQGPVGLEGLSPDGFPQIDTSGVEERLDLDRLANLGLSVGMPRSMDLDEETVGFWSVSREPVLLEEIIPVYPQEAKA